MRKSRCEVNSGLRYHYQTLIEACLRHNVRALTTSAGIRYLSAMIPATNARLLLRRALLGTLVLSSGCLDATRLNSRCDWVGDSAFAVDMANPDHWDHLKRDVRIAGENAVRYGDVAGRNIALESARLDACLDSLYARIEVAHGVTRSTISTAARMRDWGIDTVLVWAPSAFAFMIAAHFLIGRALQRRAVPAASWERAVMLMWLGLSVSVVGVGFAHLWGWIVDDWRLRTGHMSFRAAYLPVGMYWWQAYLGALGLFAAVAVYAHRRTATRAPDLPRANPVDRWKR